MFYSSPALFVNSSIILLSSTASTELCLTTLNCKGRLPLEALVVSLGCVLLYNGPVGLLRAPQVHLMVCWSVRAHYSENPCHCPCPFAVTHFSSPVMRCLYLHQVLITNAEAWYGIPCLPLPAFMSDTCKWGIKNGYSYCKCALRQSGSGGPPEQLPCKLKEGVNKAYMNINIQSGMRITTKIPNHFKPVCERLCLY